MKKYTKAEDLISDYKKALEAHKNSFLVQSSRLLNDYIRAYNLHET